MVVYKGKTMAKRNKGEKKKNNHKGNPVIMWKERGSNRRFRGRY